MTYLRKDEKIQPHRWILVARMHSNRSLGNWICNLPFSKLRSSGHVDTERKGVAWFTKI